MQLLSREKGFGQVRAQKGCHGLFCALGLLRNKGKPHSGPGWEKEWEGDAQASVAPLEQLYLGKQG